jgi:hypothetical protein
MSAFEKEFLCAILNILFYYIILMMNNRSRDSAIYFSTAASV